MNKKNIQTIRFLNNGCYPGYVMFSCGFSYDEIIKFLKKHNKTGGDLWALGLQNDKNLINNGKYFALKREFYNKKSNQNRTFYYIILKNSFLFDDFDYIALSHECLHICQFFLPDILNRNKEIEAEAYYHSHLMTQCLKVIRE